MRARILMYAPTLSLQPKSDVSGFGQVLQWPNSGKPEFGCKRGRGRRSRSPLVRGNGRERYSVRSVLADARAGNDLAPFLHVVAVCAACAASVPNPAISTSGPVRTNFCCQLRQSLRSSIRQVLGADLNCSESSPRSG